MSDAGFPTVGFTETYGEETGPKTSETVPTCLSFSSTTFSPIFGGVSTLMTMFRLGVT